MNLKLSRREIVKNGAIFATGLGAMSLVGCNKNKPGTEATKPPPAPAAPATPPIGDPLISLDNQIAKNLKYIHDATEADPKLRVDKAGVKGAEQFCSNCQFYKPVEGKDYGACQLIPVTGKNVAGKGWCGTWAKKA